MNDTKPTPGPWRTMGGAILGPEGELIADALESPLVPEQSAANAALICRAVNCHAELVAALRSAEAYFDEHADADLPSGADGYRGNEEMRLLVEARAAIAKAQS